VHDAGLSSVAIASGASERAVPAIPRQSSGPAASSSARVGTRRKSSVRRPARVATASVSAAPVKSSL
jgi:hypothetical protein